MDILRDSSFYQSNNVRAPLQRYSVGWIPYPINDLVSLLTLLTQTTLSIEVEWRQFAYLVKYQCKNLFSTWEKYRAINQGKLLGTHFLLKSTLNKGFQTLYHNHNKIKYTLWRWFPFLWVKKHIDLNCFIWKLKFKPNESYNL